MAKKTRKPSISNASKPKKEPRVTMASTAYALIKAGKTNAEVLRVLKDKFSLPAKHDYYPRWYRSRLVQDGEISKTFAAEHSGEAPKEKEAPRARAAKKHAAKPAPEKKPEAQPSAA